MIGVKELCDNVTVLLKVDARSEIVEDLLDDDEDGRCYFVEGKLYLGIEFVLV